MKYLFVLMLLVTVSIAQQKEQRYQIVEVEKLHSDIDDGKMSTSGTKKNLMMIDTQNGKTWYLTSYSVLLSDGKTSITKFEWTPIRFSNENIKNLTPPKESPVK